MKPSRWIVVASMLLILGFLVVPVATYLTGGRLIGPYAGQRGLASYLGMIYSDAGRGRIAALALVFGPLLGIGVWPLRAWILRRLNRGPVEP